jgi:hypothetical protein
MTTKEIMQKIADTINNILPEGFGFCVLVYKHNEPGLANYISNSEREDMVKALFETAYRLKENQDTKY